MRWFDEDEGIGRVLRDGVRDGFAIGASPVSDRVFVLCDATRLEATGCVARCGIRSHSAANGIRRRAQLTHIKSPGTHWRKIKNTARSRA
jgi:hypothetical protein